MKPIYNWLDNWTKRCRLETDIQCVGGNLTCFVLPFWAQFLSWLPRCQSRNIPLALTFVNHPIFYCFFWVHLQSFVAIDPLSQTFEKNAVTTFNALIVLILNNYDYLSSSRSVLVFHQIESSVHAPAHWKTHWSSCSSNNLELVYTAVSTNIRN